VGGGGGGGAGGGGVGTLIAGISGILIGFGSLGGFEPPPKKKRPGVSETAKMFEKRIEIIVF
jgi:hypothetical protein